MAKKKKNNIGLVSAVVVGVGVLVSVRKPTAKTNTNVRTGTATAGESSGGGSIYNPPATGFVITGVGQTVTGLSTPQTVTAPARVINLTATPAGTYSGSVTLKTANGTVLHTENIADLNISSGAGAYPAIYFNPNNPLWKIQTAGVYTMVISFTIQGTVYTRTVELTVTNADLGIVSGGNSGVSVLDYSISNGNQVVLTLSGGTPNANTTIQLKQGSNVVGTLTATYAGSMTIQTSAFGYLEVWVDGTDLGVVYVPQQITGAWVLERAKAENDGIMSLEVNKVGGSFLITDTANNSGWPNVEYWHNTTFLGTAIPNGYAIEPNVIHHFTKKVWGSGGGWISYERDTNPKQKRQQTLKIVPQ